MAIIFNLLSEHCRTAAADIQMAELYGRTEWWKIRSEKMLFVLFADLRIELVCVAVTYLSYDWVKFVDSLFSGIIILIVTDFYARKISE